jgi:RNA polymerase sigma factor (TIGR02999 family)
LTDPDRVTILLNAAAQGDPEAAREVFPLIYAELRQLASARVSRLPPGATFQTTVLVHEAYLRLVQRNPAGWQGARHFHFTAARAMRDILVEDARRKFAVKRGGGSARVDLDSEEIPWPFDVSPHDVLSIDAALTKLQAEDPIGHQLVLLYFYSGLGFAEIAEAMEVSLRTVERKWRFLRTWLARELDRPPG